MNSREKSEQFLLRLEKFADDVNVLCGSVKFGPVTKEIVDQLSRSASSIGANYIEAMESLSQKDFYFRIRICRKESKEVGFWLRRLMSSRPELNNGALKLEDEARQFLLIFSKILSKYRNN